MRRLLTYSAVFLFGVFVLPALLHLAVWSQKPSPGSWHSADWSSAGILTPPKPGDAEVYIFAARTGGMKGAFATHSWIVLKKPGAIQYDRYDVVGWGRPVRKNAYDPDARWYSNEPEIQHHVTGEQAEGIIPKVEAAIAAYRWKDYGDYTLWPGPNSNTFVASIIRAVPELNAETPSSAVGRDFPEDGRWLRVVDGTLHATLGGYAGLRAGRNVGLELNFLGLVAGADILKRRLKIPGFGTVSF